MANSVTVKLEIEGHFDQLVKIKDFVHTIECEFDFDKITPMPEDIKELRNKKMTHDTDEYSIYREWLDENWGCHEPDFVSCKLGQRKLTYQFHTNAPMPYPVILKLSSLFPETTLVVYAEDEFDRMQAMSRYHRGLYGITANIICAGASIRKFTYPKIDFNELRNLMNERRSQA